MTVDALEAEDSVISESLELSKSPFSSFKIARTTSKNESEKEVEYSMDENFEDDDDEESMDVEESKLAFSKQFTDSTNRPKVSQNLQSKMSRNDILENEKEDEYLDSFIEDEEESVVLGGKKFREKADTKKNEKDFRLSESFQEIDEDDEVEEKVVKRGGKEKDKSISAVEEGSYEKEVTEVEDDDYSYRSSNLSRTTPSQGGGFGAQMGRNLGSKSLPYPSRIDEEVEDEDEENENERERERGYGMSVGGVSGKGIGKGSVKEVEEDDDDCSYSRDFEQSRFV
jgi:hypothetical protein